MCTHVLSRLCAGASRASSAAVGDVPGGASELAVQQDGALRQRGVLDRAVGRGASAAGCVVVQQTAGAG